MFVEIIISQTSAVSLNEMTVIAKYSDSQEIYNYFYTILHSLQV